MNSDKEFDKLLKDAVRRQRELGQGYGLIKHEPKRKKKNGKSKRS